MSKLQERLDLAIGAAETLRGGYVTRGGKQYNNYQCNEDWIRFLSTMSPEHKGQYNNGSGGELKEKQYPPKMASFGSSSRMIYECSKDIPGFTFEEKLDTHVGGTANLDGFMSTGFKNMYVEAKRREIYISHDNEEIKVNYRKVYEFIENETAGKFKYIITPDKEEITQKDSATKVMKGYFELNGEKVPYFDMKQVICHFLGIAYDLAKGTGSINEVSFIYLVYNPKCLFDYLENNSYNKIIEIFKKAIFIDKQAETERLLTDIFYCVLKYQIITHHLNDLSAANMKFTFYFVDQNEYQKIVRPFERMR